MVTDMPESGAHYFPHQISKGKKEHHECLREKIFTEKDVAVRDIAASTYATPIWPR
jgi:hypothetical protein